MSENAELIKDFLLESYENLDRLDRDLVELEKKPDDLETLSSIFRTIHTIKGTCGFLGFNKLEKVTHVGESLLSRLRDGELKLTAERTSAMLAMVDATREILGCIEKCGEEGNGDYTKLVDALNRLNKGEEGVFGSAPSCPAECETCGEQDAADTCKGNAIDSDEIMSAVEGPVPPIRTIDVDAVAAEADASSTHETFAPPVPVVVDGRQVTQKVVGEDVVVSQSSTKAATDEKTIVAPAGAQAGADAEHVKGSSVADAAIRVDVNLLDKLMNLVGELVLARNQILQHTASSENAALGATTQRLNLITTELQEGVMKTRMQPINMVWQKLPRVVRDLSAQFNKHINLQMEGKETELDKTIIEAIKDPLTHIVRNSVDHGIETPEKRKAAGKPPEGTLTLRAFHEGGQVNIEIIDDGAGINAEKVKAKAIEKGLITSEQAARMSEREANGLIFLPGFSTAEKVTNVSGRGVGMDVVKTNIEKIGGTVDIQTRPGEGTTLRIKIPLTLAIIPALLVTSGGERFAIPQVSLLELVRLDGDEALKQVEKIHDAPVFRLRGNLLPLTDLNEQLKLPTREDNSAVNIVVLQADGRQFGLVVDEINDTEEIVVKPLGKQLKGLTTFAGATIMGDGKVALILDVMGLAQSANMIGESRDSRLSDAASSRAAGGAKQSMLLFRVGQKRRMGVLLSTVSRLEEFSNEKLETEGETEVVQYRGKIMPLVRLSSLFPDPGHGFATTDAAADSTGRNLNVIVYAKGDRNVGLVVDVILDIIEDTIVVDRRKARSGVTGSAVVQGKVTELIDVEAIVAEYLGANGETAERESATALAA
jgi:two-component system chemotaxis sensor kinase CheA